MRKSQKKRSDQEWLALFQECRTSGMTDKDWCELNSIPVSSFYNKISKLRKKNYDILSSSQKSTRSVQEVVPLEIKEESPIDVNDMNTQMQQEFVPTVIIRANNFHIEISNGAAKNTILDTLMTVQQLC